MDLDFKKKNAIKSKIKVLLDTGINKDSVFNLIDELLKENVIIDNTKYITTKNAFNSDLMLLVKNNTGKYVFYKYLKEVKND